MKDIIKVRVGLQKIPYALGPDVPPNRPHFGGSVTKLPQSNIDELEESNDGRSSEVNADVRNPEEVYRQLDELVAQGGMDVLAWYHPFHASASQWGIYVPNTSLHYCADRWFSHRISSLRRIAIALRLLLDHEIIHFASEYAVAQYELLLQASCWMPARDRLKSAGVEWFNDEEALANANSIRRLSASEPHTIVDRVHKSLLNSPPGYRHFPVALSDEGFEDHLLEVLRHNAGIPAVDLKTGILDPAFDSLVAFPEIDEALEACPLYLIDDGRQFGLPALAPRFITRLPQIIETNRFQKQLRKIDPSRREEWLRMKAVLADTVPRYPKFKKLKGSLNGLWGIYLNDGFRVHIRPAANGVWEAVEIGSHGDMGHE